MKKITLLCVALLFSIVGFSQTIIIGTGTDNTDGTGSDPVSDYYNSERYQVVYTAAELSASLTPFDELTGLGFSVSEVGGTLAQYSIKIGHTSAANSAAHDVSPTSEVKAAFDYTPTATAAGMFDMIAFDTNFVWNGVDNIVVDICTAGSNPFGAPYGGVRTTNGVTDGSRSERIDGAVACGNPTDGTNTNRPNIQFSYVDGTPPACLPPNNLMASAITDTQASLSWTSGGSGEAMWDVEVVTSGSSATGTPTDMGVGNPFTKMSLTASTAYDYYVRADCGGSGSSTWSGPFTFTTECATFTAPFLEAFTASSLPNCWIQGGDNVWEYDGFQAYGAAAVTDHSPGGAGSFIGMDGSDNGDGEVSTLSSPLIDVSALTTPLLSYWVFSNNVDDAAQNSLMVEVYDGAAWNTVETIQANLGANWTEYTSDLSALTITGNVQIRFTVTGVSNGGDAFYNDILLDDVEIKETPLCTQVVVGSSMVMPDCVNAQFSVDVDVTTVGDATEITDGTSTWAITGTGITTAGPFADGTTVTLSVTHSDVACNLSLNNFTYQCPPANNDCVNAEVVVPSLDTAKVWSTGTTIGNTASGETPTPTCSSFGSSRDVWYTVEVPAAGDITIETQASGGSPLTDTGMQVLSGSCGTFTQVGCDDDGGTGAFSLVALTGQTPGDILYVRVFEYANSASKLLGPDDGTFEISAHAADPTLGVEEVNQIEGFNLYPNPVANTLKVSAQDNIESLQVVNMLGQVVKTATPSLQSYELDMSSLATGVYFVKANVNNVEGTYRIIKQ